MVDSRGPRWIARVDSRRASLMSFWRAPGGRLNLNEEEAIENEDADAVERGRPTVLSRGPAANVVRHAEEGRRAEEVERRFARRAMEWIGSACRGRGVARVTVFAPARMLGVLRRELKSDGSGVELREGEFMRMSHVEMAEHPAVRAAAQGLGD